MNTLTKVLIVLLTLSSIFLCGIVVTYVANADDYRQKNKTVNTKLRAAVENKKSFEKQLKENIAKSQEQEKKLRNQIASLKLRFEELQGSLKNSEREKALLLQKVNSFASIVEGFSQTNDQQGLLLKNTLGELNKVQAKQIKRQKELDETTAALVEKMAIIETLEAEKKRLLEDKTELQSRLDLLFQPIGKTAAAPVPLTPQITTARPRPAEIITTDIDLKGSITAVDLKNSVAEISIGTADGVKEGMKFHATRGDKFICDILIIDVEAEKAVGIMELVQQQPKIGDNVSTNL